MMKRLYFAYGSNLNLDDWRDWCDRHGFSTGLLTPVESAYLADFTVGFRYRSHTRKGGVLDIVPRPGHMVPGIIFEVDEEGWDALDQKEGAPACYERFETIAITECGEEVLVVTYRVCAQRVENFVPPNPAYVQIVCDGLEAYDLGCDHIRQAACRECPETDVSALFAYGTLMRGQQRFPLIRQFGLTCTLLAETRGRLLDIGDYPAIADLNTADSVVQGDFLRIERIEEALEYLDQIEGFRGFGQPGSLFRRTLRMVCVGDGRFRQAWIYTLADTGLDSGAIIPCGDWREHQGCRTAFLRSLVRTHTCGHDPTVVQRLVEKCGLTPPSDGSQVEHLLPPLAKLLASGLVSERKLAQASGQWSITKI